MNLILKMQFLAEARSRVMNLRSAQVAHLRELVQQAPSDLQSELAKLFDPIDAAFAKVLDDARATASAIEITDADRLDFTRKIEAAAKGEPKLD